MNEEINNVSSQKDRLLPACFASMSFGLALIEAVGFRV
jgi:hypothetical protein